jgi:hypothetical protein
MHWHIIVRLLQLMMLGVFVLLNERRPSEESPQSATGRP